MSWSFAAVLAVLKVRTGRQDPASSIVVLIGVESETLPIYLSNIKSLARRWLGSRLVLVTIAIGGVVLYGHGCHGFQGFYVWEGYVDAGHGAFVSH